MNFIRSAFARRAAVVMLAAVAAALPQIAVGQSNPLAGTWKFLPEKSTFTPGPARYQSMTLTFSASGDPVMNAEGMDANGRPVKASYTVVPDGKPHPVTGMATFDSASWTRYSDANSSYSYFKGKSIVALGTRSLSADGKTLTFREQIIDRNGKPSSTALMVFENPDVQVASVAPAAAAATAAAAPAAAQSALTPDETAGTEALAKGDSDEAIRLFTKVIDAKQQTATLYYDHISRAIAYGKKGQNDQALADFDEALKLKPDNLDARFRRGTLRAQLKQHQGAIEDMTAVIQADPMNGDAYRLRAYSYITLGDDKNASPDYEKACAINKQLCL